MAEVMIAVRVMLRVMLRVILRVMIQSVQQTDLTKMTWIVIQKIVTAYIPKRLGFKLWVVSLVG